MKFRFALEKVLKQKEIQRDIEARQYAEANYQYHLELKKLNQLYQEIDNTRLETHQRIQNGGALIEELKNLDAYIWGSQIRIEEQRRVLREKLQILEVRQEALTEAMKEHKIFETLKAKKREEFRAAQLKKEMKEIDDIVVMRHLQKSSMGY